LQQHCVRYDFDVVTILENLEWVRWFDDCPQKVIMYPAMQ